MKKGTDWTTPNDFVDMMKSYSLVCQKVLSNDSQTP